MKRLILLATMMVAVLASCEKHEIRNEVLTEIGFTSNVGKQTKAIADGTDYLTTQPFGVLAYSHQGNIVTKVMDNVEIKRQGSDADGWNWKASGDTKYYWPNDASTTMNFYAYSPAIYTTVPEGIKNHQKLNGEIVVDGDANADGIQDPQGININGYTHTNMYVDFMVADYVTGATFVDQDGTLTSNTPDLVPAKFKHQMSQLIFKVKTDIDYRKIVEENGNQVNKGITFTLNKITLNNIKNTGDIKNGAFDNTTTGSVAYEIFPAKAEDDANGNGAPSITSNQSAQEITSSLSDYIIPVTMIPQAYTNQSFTIEYSISGNGVATETVTKTISFGAAPAWIANKKITYTLTIGMKEIKFSPSIQIWGDNNADGDIEDEGEGNYEQTIQIQ